MGFRNRGRISVTRGDLYVAHQNDARFRRSVELWATTSCDFRGSCFDFCVCVGLHANDSRIRSGMAK